MPIQDAATGPDRSDPALDALRALTRRRLEAERRAGRLGRLSTVAAFLLAAGAYGNAPAAVLLPVSLAILVLVPLVSQSQLALLDLLVTEARTRAALCPRQLSGRRLSVRSAPVR